LPRERRELLLVVPGAAKLQATAAKLTASRAAGSAAVKDISRR